MPEASDYTIHGNHQHFGWDNSIPPVSTISPGAVVEFECDDASAGHITDQSTADDISTIDFARINPVTGPIFIDGAKPGDTLKITVNHFAPSGFGWTANIPGFGLLADQFSEPALHIWDYDEQSLSPCAFGRFAKVPLKPFAGTMGLALAEPGPHSIVPPRQVGGNLDIRDLSRGSVLYLPVEVDGGLFSVGDTHAAQGDGEVCGTAIESPMDVVLTLDLVKNQAWPMPRFTTPGPVTAHIDTKGYEVTTGVGPDLIAGARMAVSQMVDLLISQHNMSAVEAYMLCSVCGDLRISEIVDQPNWIVSFYLPRSVFD
jgi:acetamidase/formamidase